MRKSRPTLKNTAGVILCGGEGRRFGGNKPTSLFHGEALIDRIEGRLRPQCAKVAVSVGKTSDIETTLDRILDIPVTEGGPIIGVLAAMRWAAVQKNIQFLVTTPTDTPFFPLDMVRCLADGLVERGRQSAVAFSGARMHGLSALYDIELLSKVASIILEKGARRMDAFHEVIGSAVVPFSNASVDPFFNINTKQEMTRALALSELFPEA